MPNFLRAWFLQPLLNFLHQLQANLTMDQAQLAQALADIKEQNEKARAEIVAKIAALEAAVTAAGSTTPAVDAALADLRASVQADDDLTPDSPADPAPTVEPTPPT